MPETLKNRMLRFHAHPDGTLGGKEVVGPDNLGVGAAVDSFASDADGNIWLTTSLRNAVGIIMPDGDYHVVFEEANEPLLQTFEEWIATSGERITCFSLSFL